MPKEEKSSSSEDEKKQKEEEEKQKKEDDSDFMSEYDEAAFTAEEKKIDYHTYKYHVSESNIIKDTYEIKDLTIRKL